MSGATALLSDALLADHGAAGPYAAFRRLREEHPALLTRSGVLVLSRHADCTAALRDRRLGKVDESLGFRMTEVPDDLARRAMHRFRRTMLFRNPPDHARLRRVVTGAFTPHHVERLRATIREQVEQLVGGLIQAGGGDIVADIALPLPVDVIGTLLGVSASDRHAAAPLVRDLVAPLEPTADADAVARAADAEDTLAAYFEDLIAEKRRRPADDLLSRLSTAHGSEVLDTDECVGTAILLFAAGFETTTNLIGNAVNALLNHPEQADLFRHNPQLARSAVDELLRFDAPVQTNGRTVMQPTRIADTDLEAGQVVLTLLGAANRDPAAFDRPDDLDLTRTSAPLVSFGAGIHFCLGAPLARLETTELITQLFVRAPTLTASPGAAWRRGLSFRGPAYLPVHIS